MTKAPSAGAGTEATLGDRSAPRARGTRRAGAFGALVLLAVGAAGALLAGGAEEDESPPVFVPSTHRIEYEVTAATPGATAESIQYIVGAGNRVKTVAAPKLPFRVSVPLEVGPGGGIAQVIGGNGGGGGALACALKVDGEVAFAVTAPRETDVGCSTPIAPATQ